MRITILLVFFVIMFSSLSQSVFGEMILAKSESGGVYEDGIFSSKDDIFEARYTIDENKGIIRLEDIIKNEREGRIEEGAEYEITNIVVSEGISALLVSRDKKGQKIITAVREGAMNSSEILMIGSDFYQYCKSENGKFYLEYGEALRESKSQRVKESR